ncbi:MAG: hypothetical protein AAFO29_16755, partial [Actinomycetota bacterium]
MTHESQRTRGRLVWLTAILAALALLAAACSDDGDDTATDSGDTEESTDESTADESEEETDDADAEESDDSEE